ncbi:MAG: hypothetical protein QNK23_11480 [Crocinitomicaceae bacterium]|nr:hypothetical protein [Crocinitomicaceae bacterium]
MKIILLCFTTLICSISYSQQSDLSLARVGDYVLGVYLFVDCDPVNNYDYVGKVDKFDVFESDRKDIEKIIKKARKKNPFFNGMIFKKDFKHVELIKFIVSDESVAGFKIGDQVIYKKLGAAIHGTIIALDDAKQKAVIEYLDDEGGEHLDKILLKNLSHQ